ncbi:MULTISPECIES: hypothetical protein [Holospora]|uniref:Uncharacterized protein n=2 Tax=Holospora TaxID=44747 RepID=A0A061JHV9_9PROT|nr:MULTISPECIES: hypothetical protein [Holospora]ETZ04524.1 hypothetical protein K737_301065 [Holospora undulata HU1]GAJ45991.1 hypothetical protein HE1_00311 [Holospora elegans E1]
MKFFNKTFQTILTKILGASYILTILSTNLQAECNCKDKMGDKVPSFSGMMVDDLTAPDKVKNA